MLEKILSIMKLLIVSLLLLLGLTASLLWVMHRGAQWESPISEQPAMPVQEAINPPEPWQPRSIQTDLPASSKGEKIRYGYDLITETYKYLGPELEDANSIYAGNNLACKNCHLGSGTQAGAASYVGVSQRFPQFRGREGREGTLEDRINGCMERSMNGQRLAVDSKEMQAMVAYMDWLSEDVPTAEMERYAGFVNINIPERAADTLQGKLVYQQQCVVCHGTDGQGQKNPGKAKGYAYPPVWGDDSYNHGAGMNRVITAARFIKANMPFGATADSPILTDEQAYDVAAYIDAHTRPTKAGTDKDYPDLKRKPVDSPYGPYYDSFPAEQHKFGPFQPIQQYYKNLKEEEKNDVL
jgi:thiosulfate dehydrogenase